MKLVVDTNILVSFFRPNPVSMITSNINLFNLNLFSPEYVIEELNKNKKDILKYSKLSSEQFNKKLTELRQIIKIIRKFEYKRFKAQAQKLAPHDKDIPIFALALKLDCPIWSNELEFKNQNKINILSTRDMMELLFS